MNYSAIGLDSFLSSPQAQYLTRDQKETLRVLHQIFPFKTNSYVVNELIDWQNSESDPMYQLNFPQAGMLDNHDFILLKTGFKTTDNSEQTLIRNNVVTKIKRHHFQNTLSQKHPVIQIPGVYHGLCNTAFLFPQCTRECHAYCNYCLRYIRHFGIGKDLFYQFPEEPISYLNDHPEILDVIISGGDAFIASARRLREYVNPLLQVQSLQAIRFSTKALAWWPYRFVSDDDADELLGILDLIIKSGKHCTIMAHFSHPRELQTTVVKKAIQRIQSTGTIIRTQGPIVQHINDHETVWEELWKEQVKLALIPYYMFLESSFSMTDYFKVPINKALRIFSSAQKKISGLCRTVKGPVCNRSDQKISVEGIVEIECKKYFVLKVIHSQNIDAIGKILLAAYDDHATCLEQLNIVG